MGLIVLMVLILSTSVPLYQARASVPGAVATAAFCLVTDVGCGTGIIEQFINFLNGVLANGTGLLSTGTTAVLSYGIANAPVVRDLWATVRDFANMFFIIALIIMAFGTIFNVGGYNFSSLIVKFLIVVLLINFSLVIGNIIIDWSQSLSNVFLTSIGDIGNRVAQGTALADTFTNSLKNSPAITQTGWDSTMAAFAKMILLSIIFFSMMVLFFFSIVRIPILWALLIASPIAWIGFILPTTRKVWHNWWREFIGWNIFMPLYLFIIYFGSYMLAQQQRVAANFGTDPTRPLIDTLGITAQQLFFFILVGIVFIGGAKIARSMSITASAGAVAGGIWARSAAVARWGASAPIGFGQYIGRRTGVTGAMGEKLGEIQKKGLPGRLGYIYGGEEGAQRLQSGVAQRFGAQETADKTLAQAVTSARQRVQKITDLTELQNLSQNGTKNEKIAALEILEERQGLNGGQVLSLYDLYGGASSMNARRAIEKVDLKHLSKPDRDMLYNQVNNLRLKQKIADVRAENSEFADIKDAQGNIVKSAEDVFVEQSTIFTSEADKADYVKKAKDYLERLKADQRRSIFNNSKVTPDMKKEMAMVMAEKGDFGDMTTDQLKDAANLFQAANQKDNFLSRVQKKNIIAALKAKESLQLLGNDTYDQALKKAAGKLSTEDILELSKDTISNSDFQTALEANLTPGRISSIISHPKASAEKVEALNTLFFKVRNDAFIDEKIKPLDKYLDNIKNLTTGIRSAKAANDSQKAAQLSTEAQRILNMARKIVDELAINDSATKYQVDAAKNEFEQIKTLLTSLK